LVQAAAACVIAYDIPAHRAARRNQCRVVAFAGAFNRRMRVCFRSCNVERLCLLNPRSLLEPKRHYGHHCDGDI
jgi:hypothetical protein